MTRKYNYTMPTGRPTKYKPEYCQEVIDFMAKGLSKEAFAGEIKVSTQQIYRWMKKHKNFRTAIRKAENACQAFWEKMGVNIAAEGQGNAAVWIFNMKNRFRNTGWADATSTDLTTKGEKLPGGITDGQITRLIGK